MYTLSNHNQNVMSGLWKDLPYKVSKKVKENWLDTLFFLVPVVGTYQCVPARAQQSVQQACAWQKEPACLGRRAQRSLSRNPSAARALQLRCSAPAAR